MAPKVCLAANTLNYPQGGGHLWVYLNWALSLRAAGCEVSWLETVKAKTSNEQLESYVSALKQKLEPYEFGQTLLLCPEKEASGTEVPDDFDLLININYRVPSNIVDKFPKSIVVDIDPGLNQVWISMGHMRLPDHDLYFTIGETVGKMGAMFPDCGIEWHYTPPPVYLSLWPVTRAESSSAYTTVTHWWGSLMEYRGKSYYNGKRSGFLPYAELPRHTDQPLELAIYLTSKESDERDRELLIRNGWRLKSSHEVASTALDYQRYIQNSLGEFSCAKPSCVHLQNAWISDRTICYLASGKPAIVEHTGPSSFLPDSEGLFRFRNMQEAVSAFQKTSAEYEQQCRAARALAEEYFDGKRIVTRILELAL